ncbi:hypothetical protein VKS41_005444 [Umbelopsis sp. WA50703]
MYKLTASLALLALTQAAMAAISITNPVAGTTWKQGSKATIAWTATGDDASGTVEITLMQGAATLLQTVETISDSVKGSASGKYTWTVPKDTPNGADYTVAFGSSPTFYYSHYFTIGKAAANSSASAAASGSAATSSVPLSTAAVSTALPSVASAAASGSSNSSASASAPSASASTSSGARSAAAAIAVPAVAAAVAVAALF